MTAPAFDAFEVADRRHDTELQDLVDLVRDVCGTSMAAISLRRDDAFHFLVVSGTERASCPEADALCAYAFDDDAAALPPLDQDPRFVDNPLVDGRVASFRTYASAPLHDPRGDRIGRLCVMDDEHREIGPTHLAALSTLAGSIDNVMRLRMHQVEDSLTDSAEDVVAHLSHDLRVPLMAAMTCLGRLEELAPGGPAGAAVIATAQRLTGQVRDLVEDLLDEHAAPDSGRSDPDPT